MGKITVELKKWELGDESSFEELMRLVVTDLRKIAARLFRPQRRNHTLQPTALVSELCMTLMKQSPTGWENRAEFFHFAARLMRNIIVNHAIRKNNVKNGRDISFVPLTGDVDVQERPPLPPEVVLDIHRALERFEKVDPTGSKIVELLLFAGLTVHETARALGIADSTVYRNWKTANLWLAHALGDSPKDQAAHAAPAGSLPSGSGE